MNHYQASEAQLVLLPVDVLVPNQFQPRKNFEPQAIAELAASIKQHGLLQPIVVRPAAQNQCYEIIAGERRWRAAQHIGLMQVKCLIHVLNDEQAAGAAMVENLIRADLNPIEEAQAYARLIELFGYCHEDIALIIGHSRAKITNSLRLLKLMKPVQNLLINQAITVGHAKILASLPESLQIAYANKCQQAQWSVRQLEKAIKKITKNACQTSMKQDWDRVKLESQLSEHLGCPVHLLDNKGKGKLVLEYYNLETLESILTKFQFKFDD